MPAEALLWIRVRHPALPEYSFWSHTAIGALPSVIPGFASEMKEGRKPVFFVSPGEIKLHRARVVHLTIRSQATGELVSGARVSLADAAKPKSFGMDAWGYVAYGTTDRNGIVELRLPPEEFRWFADPVSSLSMVRSSGVINVPASPLIQRQQVKLQDGAIVKFTVLEEATGKGIPDCRFWMQYQKPGQWVMVSRSTTWIDSSKDKTQADGTMLAVMEAKPATFRVECDDRSYAIAEPITVVLTAGKTAEVKFVLKRK
jgi:hypothetical protein